MDPNYVKIFDTTLRDGEQAPGNSMNLDEKLRIAHQLERLGVDVIEAGFPIASPDDFEAVKAISSICKNAEVCGLARSTEKDIKTAWDALKNATKPRIHTFIATSPIHMEHKLRKTPEQVLQMTEESVKLARSLCDRVDFSPEDATRSEPNFLYKVISVAIQAGADTINIPDTVGYSSPEEFKNLIEGIIANVPASKNIILSTHCHDDLGLAVANSLAGVRGGARQIECTINGIGERAGNAALEECVMALQTRNDYYHLETGIKTTELYPSSKLLTSVTGVTTQPNKAIVGANAFAHEAGIHQDGILKNRETYEIMKAEDVGMKSNSLVLGKHSGRHALKDRAMSLGIDLNDKELEDAYEKFIALADKKKQIFDEDLVVLFQKKEQEDEFTFVSADIRCGTDTEPTATITLQDKTGTTKNTTCAGDGPVDAAFAAVNSIIDMPNILREFSVNAITEGIDAQATVAIQIDVDSKIYSGNSADTDIVVASIKAYIEAINRSITSKKITTTDTL